MNDNGFWSIMTKSLFSDDWYILLACVCEIIFWSITCYICKSSRKAITQKSEKDFKQYSYSTLAVPYNIFLCIISIFPLLGMFGTVQALIEIDFSSPSVDMKSNFFHALTSTAWGIIFSIVFKIIHSVKQTSIETQLSKLEIMMNDNVISGDKNEK